MDDPSLVLAIREVVAREVGIEPGAIQLDSQLGDFDIDSLDIMRLAVVFERTFKINVAAGELGGLVTFGDIVSTIERKIKM